jgi:hypothetical protein
LGKYNNFLFLVYPKLISTIPLSLNYIHMWMYWGSFL